ncbi:hypothetical protein QCA50_010449 [Cerrena zonata]|uniref:Uncharacterized protein n=1 Tax=Cerrena zonata TaxID=2478898 RepID=A0AAW0G7G4_9APHY
MNFELRPQPPVGRSTDTAVENSPTTTIKHIPNVQHLPPIDEGWKAWSYCVSGFVIEALSWGFASSYGIFQGWPQ